MALKVNVPITGNLGTFSPTSTPGVDNGPRSPGEAPNQFLTPDCPKSEAQIAQMEKKS